MPAEQILSNAQIVTADRMFLGSMVLRDGKIVDLAEGRSHFRAPAWTGRRPRPCSATMRRSSQRASPRCLTRYPSAT